ncbi:ACP S-malonyltransferase [Myxococcus guangdongensis]|uniref:ACP S-malonyltransferase n=1 Tax=Myxococcus guangdongensis TaxID=2906760 RepID=UPI00225DF7C3|nr:ACP S-malonyltransferase [Myxococcus guangdongensis]
MNDTAWAWLFPGQGSQKVGMGRKMLERSSAARRVFEEASDAIGEDLKRLCLDGPFERLTATENAQPAIVTVSVACLVELEERGLKPSVVVGHSVGEFSALVAAGCMPLATAVRAVRKRGQLMASVTTPGGMLAVMGLDGVRLAELCHDAAREGVVVMAIHNSPKQFVLSGDRSVLERFKDVALSAGATECVMLDVSHAFHSPLMGQVEEVWKSVVAGLQLRMPRYPVLLNTTAKPVKTLVCIRRSLLTQITGPVLWSQCMQALVEQGVTRVLEVGDSKVVSSLARRTAPTLQTLTFLEPTVLGQLAHAC